MRRRARAEETRPTVGYAVEYRGSSGPAEEEKREETCGGSQATTIVFGFVFKHSLPTTLGSSNHNKKAASSVVLLLSLLLKPFGVLFDSSANKKTDTRGRIEFVSEVPEAEGDVCSAACVCA